MNFERVVLFFFWIIYKIICCEINKTKIKIEDLGIILSPPPHLPPITISNIGMGVLGVKIFVISLLASPLKNESTCLKISHILL